MSTISLRLSEEDRVLFNKYAELQGLSMSELVRQSVLDRIENELDLKAYDAAMQEYLANPVTYSHEEVVRILEDD